MHIIKFLIIINQIHLLEFLPISHLADKLSSKLHLGKLSDSEILVAFKLLLGLT